jgi:hypothetical protein
MKKDSFATTKKRDSGKTIKRPLVAIAVPYKIAKSAQ